MLKGLRGELQSQRVGDHMTLALCDEVGLLCIDRAGEASEVYGEQAGGEHARQEAPRLHCTCFTNTEARVQPLGVTPGFRRIYLTSR